MRGDGSVYRHLVAMFGFIFGFIFFKNGRQSLWLPFGRHVFEFEFKSGDRFVIAVLSPFCSINKLRIVVDRIFWKLKN